MRATPRQEQCAADDGAIARFKHTAIRLGKKPSPTPCATGARRSRRARCLRRARQRVQSAIMDKRASHLDRYGSGGARYFRSFGVLEEQMIVGAAVSYYFL